MPGRSFQLYPNTPPIWRPVVCVALAYGWRGPLFFDCSAHKLPINNTHKFCVKKLGQELLVGVDLENIHNWQSRVLLIYWVSGIISLFGFVSLPFSCLLPLCRLEITIHDVSSLRTGHSHLIFWGEKTAYRIHVTVGQCFLQWVVWFAEEFNWTG